MNDAKVTLYLVQETPLACQFSIGDNHSGEPKFWIPRSLISLMSKDPPVGGWRRCRVTIPAWKCEQLGLEDES